MPTRESQGDALAWTTLFPLPLDVRLQAIP